MKKSSLVQVVLLAAVLASCNNRKNTADKKVHIRTDSTASYSRSSGGSGGIYNRYYVFRPYGTYDQQGYHKAGYYSSAISENSNIGHNQNKGGIVRGGFGRSGGSRVGS